MMNIRTLIVTLVMSPSFAMAKLGDCGPLLGTPAARAAQAAASRILAEDVDEAVAYAFAGVTNDELFDLLNTGRIRRPIPLRITTDHPYFSRLKIQRVDWTDASRLAVRDAWVRSSVARLRAGKLAPTLNDSQVAAVLESLYRAGKVAIRPTPDELASAIRGAGLAVTLEIPELPVDDGARLVLGERSSERIRFGQGSWYVTSIRTEDVLAIQPSSPRLSAVLDELADGLGAK